MTNLEVIENMEKKQADIYKAEEQIRKQIEKINKLKSEIKELSYKLNVDELLENDELLILYNKIGSHGKATSIWYLD